MTKPTGDAAARHKRFLAACDDAKARRENLQPINQIPQRAHAGLRARLLEDLHRVYNHPDNPFHGWAASRARYRQLGHFPEAYVYFFFGTHEEFLRTANLRDSRGTSAHKLQVARVVTEQKIAEYARQHVLRFQGKFDKGLRSKTGEKVMIVGSDLHAQFLDPFAWQVFLDVVKMTDPDVVVLNGDVVDFWAASRHLKLPGEGSINLQQEIDFTRKEILGRLRKAAPRATITWHIGNHEYRLVRYLADTAPELACLDCLSFDKLFGIEEFEIEMIFGGNFLAPKKSRQRKEIEQNWKRYYDCYAITHGTSIGTNPASDQIRRYGMSGTSGHTHRPNLVYVPTLACPTANWMSTGMLAGFAVGKDYVSEPSAWTMGFGVATIIPERQVVLQTPVVMQGGVATFAGRVWTETPAAENERSKMR